MPYQAIILPNDVKAVCLGEINGVIGLDSMKPFGTTIIMVGNRCLTYPDG